MAILALCSAGCRFLGCYGASPILFALLAAILNCPRCGEAAQTITEVRQLAFSADAKMLAVNVVSGPLILIWPSRDVGETSNTNTVGLLDTATLSDWTIVVRDVRKENLPPWKRNPNWNSSVAFTPDGKRLYMTRWPAGQIHSWDIDTSRWSEEPVINETNILDFSLSPDGKLFATRDRSHVVTIWDTTEWKKLMAHPHWGLPTFSADGQRLAVSTPAGVQVWNPVTQELVVTFPESQEALKQVEIGVGYRVDSTVRCVALSPDGNSLAAKNVEGLSLFSVRTRERRVLLPEFYEARRIDRGTVVKSVPQETTFGVAFSPDGSLLAAWGAYGLKFFDMTQGCKLVRSIDKRSELPKDTVLVPIPNRITCLALSPDSKTYATGDDHGVVTIWDTATGIEIRSKNVSAEVLPQN